MQWVASCGAPSEISRRYHGPPPARVPDGVRPVIVVAGEKLK
jgi:hypothetical protein